MLVRCRSKLVLISQAIGLLNAPIAGYVYVLGGVLSKFLRTLKAIEGLKIEGLKTEGLKTEEVKN